MSRSSGRGIQDAARAPIGMILRRLIFLVALAGQMGSAWAQGSTPALEAKAVFAGGCFWCMQPPFDRTPGVISTVVGYVGGREENPTYRQVARGETGHREAIEVTFDPARVSYERLLEIFWRSISPIQRDGQFTDIGDQYTTAIYYADEGQREAAEKSKEALAQSGKFTKPIATVLLPASRFWPATEYHQKYYRKNRAAYGMYRFTSGRARYLQKTWGNAP